MGRFATAVDESEYFHAFLRREPARALRLLTTRAGTLQGRLIAVVEALLEEESRAGHLTPPLPLHDLAFLLVRICETFVYTNMITGEASDPAKVEQATAALLGA